MIINDKDWSINILQRLSPFNLICIFYSNCFNCVISQWPFLLVVERPTLCAIRSNLDDLPWPENTDKWVCFLFSSLSFFEGLVNDRHWWYQYWVKTRLHSETETCLQYWACSLELSRWGKTTRLLSFLTLLFVVFTSLQHALPCILCKLRDGLKRKCCSVLEHYHRIPQQRNEPSSL